MGFIKNTTWNRERDDRAFAGENIIYLGGDDFWGTVRETKLGHCNNGLILWVSGDCLEFGVIGNIQSMELLV